MRVDPGRFVIGAEWVYRLRDDSASERVRILAIIPKKSSVRLDVAFLDAPDERVENVPTTRLRVPWSEVRVFDALMVNWRRIDDLELDDVERACVEEVFQALIPTDVAELLRSPVGCATAVRDRARTSELIDVPIEEVLASVEWFDHVDGLMLSPTATMFIAEAACRANPTPILNQIIEEETALRHNCKHGTEHTNAYTREKEHTTPEWEYDWYRRHDRPQHELLRQWCGHRAVTSQERLLAAEAENHRLDVLVTELIDALDHAGGKIVAMQFAEEHERDRITPHNIRPIVDRPLHPSEIPVREVRARRRWGH